MTPVLASPGHLGPPLRTVKDGQQSRGDGVLIALSPTLVFAACAILWLSAAFVMRGIAMTRTATAREPVDLKRLFSGLVFIGRHKVAILLDLFAVLLGNATGLLPIFARDIFMSGPLSFGALRAAPAAGALVTALTLARWPISRRVGHIMFIAVATFGAERFCWRFRQASSSPWPPCSWSAPPTPRAW